MKKFVIVFILGVLISCSQKEIIIKNIPFIYGKNNAEPNLVSKDGNLTLSWISSEPDKEATLYYSQFKEEKWKEPIRVSSGSDWFVNWADFPANAINDDLILTSFLQKSASGIYTYDVVLNLEKLSGEKIKENFLLNTDGIEAEHGFVSMIPTNKKGFFITWLDGRNTVEDTEEGHHKAMTIRFAEITNTGEIINESELDAATCDCCQTSIAMTNDGPIVVYRDRGREEIRDIYSTKYVDGKWEDPKPVHEDGWKINGCPVNGPKVVVNSTNLAVAWFTVANDETVVNVSFSTSNGDVFDAPIKLNDLDAIGRVDVAFLNSKEVLVSYMEQDDQGTYLRVKKVSIEGEVSESYTISEIDGGRNTGVPQLEIMNDEAFLVWTISIEGENQLKSIKLNSKNI
tara:strand:- start:15449 stop:16648 length:1200 start_codon:yes stop_codon:yes gene_type:complete